MDRDTLPRVKTRYAAFASGNRPRRTERLPFAGVGTHDVYNPSAPFLADGRRVIAGRVEPRDSEDSYAVFFEERGGTWQPIDDAPRYRLQDPFVARIGGELVFGGVEVTHEPAGLAWRTVFYRGSGIFDLRPFFAGPMGMKDIRLCELADGRVAVFTRPRGSKGGRGTIGYTEVPSVDALTIAAIDAAPMLEGMFHPLDWGGVNEAHLLANGEVGLIAHAAYFADDTMYSARHYYAVSFVYDPASHDWRDLRIIAARDDFAPGAAKRPDLVDVVFSSGIEAVEGAIRLYAGTSDAEAHWVDIDAPFDVPLAAGRLHATGEGDMATQSQRGDAVRV